MADCDEAIKVAPYHARSYYVRGQVHAGKEKGAAQAVADYNLAISHDPSYSAAYNARGLCGGSSRSMTTRVKDFTAALTNDRTYFEAFHNRGLTYFDRRDYPHAVEDFTAAIELNGKYAPSYLGRAAALIKLGQKGDLDKALADCDAAIRLQPKSPTGFVTLRERPPRPERFRAGGRRFYRGPRPGRQGRPGV